MLLIPQTKYSQIHKILSLFERSQKPLSLLIQPRERIHYQLHWYGLLGSWGYLNSQVTDQVSKVDVEDSPASPTSLFSDDSSSEKPQPSSAKTFSKPQPKIKVMGLEPHNVATGSALSTKQRIFQNATSGSNAKPKLPVVPKRSSLGNLGFKKTLPNPSRTTSSSKDAKPQHDPLFTDSNEITSSPTSYDPMHDVILPFEASQQSRPDLPSPEARSAL